MLEATVCACRNAHAGGCRRAKPNLARGAEGRCRNSAGDVGLFVPIFHAVDVELRHIKHVRSREHQFLVASRCAACRVALMMKDVCSAKMRCRGERAQIAAVAEVYWEASR